MGPPPLDQMCTAARRIARIHFECRQLQLFVHKAGIAQLNRAEKLRVH